MAQIKGPISYYQNVPFGMDWIVYTLSLAGMVGGLLGSIQEFRMKGGFWGILPYAGLLVIAGNAAAEGLKTADSDAEY